MGRGPSHEVTNQAFSCTQAFQHINTNDNAIPVLSSPRFYPHYIVPLAENGDPNLLPKTNKTLSKMLVN